MTVAKTAKIGLNLPDFNLSPWHDLVNENAKLLDAIIYTAFGLSNIKGAFQNSTMVTAGERYFDDATSQVFEVLTTYVTGASPATFADDRTANPGKWLLIDASAIANGLVQTLQAKDDAVSAKVAAELAESNIASLLTTLNMTALSYVGSNAKVITDWDQAAANKNTFLSGDITTSLLPSGYEGQTGGVGRAGVGIYYAVDDNNGVIQVVAYPGGNRWERRREAGVWQPWSRTPNFTEIVRRDYKLTGNADTAITGATTFGGDFYLLDAGFSNVPSYAALNDMMLSYNKDNANGVQLILTKTGRIAVRGCAAGVFTAWQEVPRTRFESAAITYANNGLVIVAHGLGAVPKFLDAYAECIVAQSGYAVGMRLGVVTMGNIYADSTNVYFQVHSSGLSGLLAGGVALALTVTSWKLRLIASL